MGFRDGDIDTPVVLDDIKRLAAIESPTADPAGVNRVLDAIAPWFAEPAPPVRARKSTRVSARCCASRAIPRVPAPASSCCRTSIPCTRSARWPAICRSGRRETGSMAPACST